MKQKPDAAEPRHRHLTFSTRTVEECEQNNNGTITDRIVTIQASEGSYEERLAGIIQTIPHPETDETHKIPNIQAA